MVSTTMMAAVNGAKTTNCRDRSTRVTTSLTAELPWEARAMMPKGTATIKLQIPANIPPRSSVPKADHQNFRHNEKERRIARTPRRSSSIMTATPSEAEIVNHTKAHSAAAPNKKPATTANPVTCADTRPTTTRITTRTTRNIPIPPAKATRNWIHITEPNFRSP
jgi:hypothetical protein